MYQGEGETGRDRRVRLFVAITVAVVIAIIGSFQYRKWQSNAEHRLSRALEAAKRDGSIKAYEDVIDHFQDEDDLDLALLGPAAEAIVRMTAGDVKEPIEPSRVDTALLALK